MNNAKDYAAALDALSGLSVTDMFGVLGHMVQVGVISGDEAQALRQLVTAWRALSRKSARDAICQAVAEMEKRR